jgi:hypothetical protein
VWLARHIAQRLRIAPYWLRTALGIAAGGLVVAFGFNLFQQLVYLDVIDPAVSITNGLLFVAGFAISIGLPVGAQTLLGAVGVVAALMIPWSNYLINPDLRPPFIFDETNPNSALPLAIFAALLLAVFTVGYLWRGTLKSLIVRRPEPIAAQPQSINS